MMQPTVNKVEGIRILALGVLLALMAAFMLLAAKPSHASTTLTVNSTGDKNDLDFPGGVFDGSSDGKCFTGDVLVVQGEECTLRAAIQEANKTAGADVIDFDIPGTGVATIAPASQLPTITGPVTINGYSQPGASPNTKAVGTDAVLKVELNGAGVQFGHGLQIDASNSSVKGLVVNRFPYDGIAIFKSGAIGNKVEGNFIGTDPSGTQDLGNSDYGVAVPFSSSNTVGGTTLAARNLISGNTDGGVYIDSGNQVRGNLIGTNRDGTTDLGNSELGVQVYGSSSIVSSNIISGNDGSGVSISGSGNKVAGNYLGTDASGTRDLGNVDYGVYIYGGSDNTVGGTTAAERNVVSDNAAAGAAIYGDGATGNRILQNSIFANAGLGVDLLGTDGPTANDPGDTDTGPNNLQNKPAITSAKTGSLKTTIRGKLNSAPNKTFVVRFFSNPSGGDEGKTFIGQTSVTPDGSGNATFPFSPASKVGLGRTITATATDSVGNTSEISAPRTVVAP